MEGTKPTFHEKIRMAQVREYNYDVVSRDIDELVDIAKKFNNMETIQKMKEVVPEYKSIIRCKRCQIKKNNVLFDE